jgi:hypothetical protein
MLQKPQILQGNISTSKNFNTDIILFVDISFFLLIIWRATVLSMQFEYYTCKIFHVDEQWGQRLLEE